eukprot:635457-Prorocentrum_lima.AAC.1
MGVREPGRGVVSVMGGNDEKPPGGKAGWGWGADGAKGRGVSRSGRWSALCFSLLLGGPSPICRAAASRPAQAPVDGWATA